MLTQEQAWLMLTSAFPVKELKNLGGKQNTQQVQDSCFGMCSRPTFSPHVLCVDAGRSSETAKAHRG
eukprot:TRINITY_DN3508_c0_g1_i1.p3 TRINITY_DN3508_c0_g1~~TRINITY_DN3508_c0_g1_i1.p3  ORF type:complete len:67 (+),score=14.62 TRINITY_DN3508_c0_g1_i1:717-917(+)